MPGKMSDVFSFDHLSRTENYVFFLPGSARIYGIAVEQIILDIIP